MQEETTFFEEEVVRHPTSPYIEALPNVVREIYYHEPSKTDKDAAKGRNPTWQQIEVLPVHDEDLVLTHYELVITLESPEQ